MSYASPLKHRAANDNLKKCLLACVQLLRAADLLGEAEKPYIPTEEDTVTLGQIEASLLPPYSRAMLPGEARVIQRAKPAWDARLNGRYRQRLVNGVSGNSNIALSTS